MTFSRPYTYKSIDLRNKIMFCKYFLYIIYDCAYLNLTFNLTSILVYCSSSSISMDIWYLLSFFSCGTSPNSVHCASQYPNSPHVLPTEKWTYDPGLTHNLTWHLIDTPACVYWDWGWWWKVLTFCYFIIGPLAFPDSIGY